MFEITGGNQLGGQMRPDQSAEARWNTGDLPPGVRQSDCDGPEDPLARASDPALWLACEPEQRERLAVDFADLRREEVRDALLESADAGGSRELGRILWPIWLRFRQQGLTQLRQRGQIRST